MKKIILLLLVSMSMSIYAQKEIKEGVMTIKMVMSSDNPAVNGQLSMMGDMKMTTYFTTNKSRSEMSSSMTGDNVTIVDNDLKKMMVLMNSPMMGKMYKVRTIEESKEDLENVKVTKKTTGKTILGYDCKGYDLLVSKDGKEVKMTVFVTDKINIPTRNTALFGDKIKGYPLSMTMEIEQMGMPMEIKMDVTKIEEIAVAASKFDMTVPEGYKEMPE